MGKRPKKKIVLFLVEGMSDKNAFEIPFGQLLEDIDPDILLEFAMVMNDDGHAGGDITSKNGIYPDNIERFIDEIMEFPIVKDTTPNMMNPRLYTTSYNKPQGQQFDDTAVLSFIKLQYT